jgi:hypothetical protein
VGTNRGSRRCDCRPAKTVGEAMNQIIYLVGLVVVILAILSFLGLR